MLRLLVLLPLIASCGVSPSKDGDLSGVVSKVHDGDSVHLMVGRKRLKVRLAGIDAPELSQAFGRQSRDHLRALINRKSVAARCHKKDRYGRSVCVILYREQDINLVQIESGLAWHYKQFQSEQSRRQRHRYSAAETRARGSKVGLWSDTDVIPPWQYRELN